MVSQHAMIGDVGAWRSPVAYSLGVRVVGRSNRLAPTNKKSAACRVQEGKKTQPLGTQTSGLKKKAAMRSFFCV